MAKERDDMQKAMLAIRALMAPHPARMSLYNSAGRDEMSVTNVLQCFVTTYIHEQLVGCVSIIRTPAALV